MSLRQKIITVMASLMVGLVLAFGLGEVALRRMKPGEMRLQNDRIILPVKRSYRYLNTRLRGCDREIVHHKNSLGFRGAEPPAEFENTLTILAVGGSTTECFYLSDGHSWPERLEMELRQDFRPLWVNNAGLDGHSTFGHTILMKEYVIPLHPKVVLFLVGLNDVGRDDLMPSDRDLLRAQRDNTFWKRAVRRWGEKSRMIGWMQNLLRTWVAARHGLIHESVDLRALPRLELAESTQKKVLDEHRGRYLPGYAQRLTALIRLTQKAGIRPVLITQPALYGKGVDPSTGVDLGTLETRTGENGRLRWRVLELYNDVTRELGRKTQVPVIELAHELRKDSAYFYDFHHFTNAGAEAVGSIVARGLAPLLSRAYPGFRVRGH